MSSQPRYRHWIQTAREGHWPSAIVCLDCVSESVPHASLPDRTVERLVSWHTVTLLSDGTGYRTVAEECGETTEGFYHRLAQHQTHQPNTWVISYQCNRIWSLMGVWERLEDGRIRLRDSDYRNSQASRERLARYRKSLPNPLRAIGGSEANRIYSGNDGYLVVEGPPNIMRARLHGAGQYLTWVDILNHVGHDVIDTMPGVDTSRLLAAWALRVCLVARDSGLTALKATAGSQAASAWRHSHYSGGVYVHTNERAMRIEEGSYFGGRCEAAVIGTVPQRVIHLDFRSQYGWVCANHPLPVRLLSVFDGSSFDISEMQDGTYGFIADISVTTDEPAYPVRRDGEVIYPVGRYRTVLCGPELVDALSYRRVQAIHAVAVYGMDYALRDYATAMYALRCQEERDGVRGSAEWIKRLIVALPGRLGQRNHRWVDCPGIMPQCMYGEWYGEDEDGEAIRYRSIGGIVQRDCVDGYAADSVPAMSAWITSVGRVRLLGAIRVAGWENVYYYDTDSLFVNGTGYDRLERSDYMTMKGLGELTVRLDPVRLEVRGVKYYVENGHVVCSGVARGNIVDSGDGRTYSRLLSAAEQARRGERPATVMVRGSYTRLQAYNHGTVDAAGTVHPIVLHE